MSVQRHVWLLSLSDAASWSTETRACFTFRMENIKMWIGLWVMHLNLYKLHVCVCMYTLKKYNSILHSLDCSLFSFSFVTFSLNWFYFFLPKLFNTDTWPLHLWLPLHESTDSFLLCQSKLARKRFLLSLLCLGKWHRCIRRKIIILNFPGFIVKKIKF